MQPVWQPVWRPAGTGRPGSAALEAPLTSSQMPVKGLRDRGRSDIQEPGRATPPTLVEPG